MKPILSGLMLASLLGAGCVTMPAPTGVHPWRRVPEKDSPAPATKTGLPPVDPVKPVKPEEVNEENLRQKVSQLEEEIHNDERGQK